MLFVLIGEAVVSALLGGAMLYIAQQVINDTENKNVGVSVKCTLRTIFMCMTGAQLLTAVMLGMVYGAAQRDVLRVLLVCSVLWPCAWSDLCAFLIPNRVLLLGTALNAVLLGALWRAEPLQGKYLLGSAIMAAGALMVAAFLCRAISAKAVGMGDIKLLGMMGLGLGMDLVWMPLFFSFAAVFIFCIFLLLTKRAKRTDSIPFAPFLLFGALAAVFLNGI